MTNRKGKRACKGFFLVMSLAVISACVSNPGPTDRSTNTPLPVVYITDSTADRVFAFRADTTSGTLSSIAGSPFLCGREPGLPAIDRSGRFLYVPNYSENDIWGYSIDPASGALAPLIGSPFFTGAGPSAVVASSSSNSLCVGCSKSGEIISYRIDMNGGSLLPMSNVRVRGGDQVILLAASGSGRLIFASNENDSTVLALTLDAHTGKLLPAPGSPVHVNALPTGLAALPSGRVLYVAHHEPDGVSAYAIDTATAALSLHAGMTFEAGEYPMAVAVSPSGRFAYAASWSGIAVYGIDGTSGALSPVSTMKREALANIIINAAGTFAYAADTVRSCVHVYRIVDAAGALRPVGSYSVAGVPFGIVSGSAGISGQMKAPQRPQTSCEYVAGAVAPFRVHVPSGSDDYFIKLERAGPQPLTVTGYIRAGETLDGTVPAGVFTLRYATGSGWQGREELFGPETKFYEVSGTLEFLVTGSKATGNEITLIPQERGNLSVESLAPERF